MLASLTISISNHIPLTLYGAAKRCGGTIAESCLTGVARSWHLGNREQSAPGIAMGTLCTTPSVSEVGGMQPLRYASGRRNSFCRNAFDTSRQ